MEGRYTQKQMEKIDYRSILRWVVDAVQEEDAKEKKRGTAEQQEDNVSYARRIVDNFMIVKGPEKQVCLEAKEDGLLIYSVHPTSTRPETFIKYRENGFKEQVESALRKWSLT
jgi:hypothetical protein